MNYPTLYIKIVNIATNKVMKIMFLIRSVNHFTFHESTIRYLAKNGHQVDIFFNQEWSKGFTDRAVNSCSEQFPNININWYLGRKDIWRKIVIALRETVSLGKYNNQPNQHYFYMDRQYRYLIQCCPTPIKLILARLSIFKKILASTIIQKLISLKLRVIPEDKDTKNFIKEQNPDVLVATPANLRFSDETDYLIAAKNQNIPTVIPVHSWDNLTTKGTFNFTPDLMLVWNKYQANEANEIHKIPLNNIVITGSPFMDKWFDSSITNIYHNKSLPTKSTYILYLGSSSNIAPNEVPDLYELANELQKKKRQGLSNISILARPHPANEKRFAEINHPLIKPWIRGRDELPDSPESLSEFSNAINESICVIGINTTGMIDAVLAGKEVIALIPESYKHSNAYNATHFKQILNSDIFHQANSIEQCLDILSKLMVKPIKTEVDSNKFINDFIRPRGINYSSGDISGLCIESITKNIDKNKFDKYLKESFSKIGQAT